MTRKLVTLAMGVALMAPLMFGQSGKAIEERKDDQQQRIAAGVKDGSLTAGETAKIEKQESKLNREERALRRQDGGKLTPADRQKLTRQQNGLSREIYRDRHNAAVQPPAKGPVGQRERAQQQRIAQGIKSGSLTPGETAKLEKKEAGLNREVNGMRQENGGRLNAADRKVINQQQNGLSKQIYKEKHDAQHQ